MMTLPDKWVRKAFWDRIHNIEVDTKTIPCYDMRTSSYTGNHYTILGSQTNVEDPNKCGNGWRSTIVIEVFTRNFKNSGSRVFADDIVQEILTETDDLSLDAASGLTIITKSISTPNDITDETLTEIVHRKFLRYELHIN